MVTVNGTLFRNQFQDTSISLTNAEITLDGAINLLNTFGAGLSNLTGAAESKTGTYTSAQAGAVMAMAQQIYAKHYKNAVGAASAGVGSVSVSYVADSELLNMAKLLAAQLIGRGFRRS